MKLIILFFIRNETREVPPLRALPENSWCADENPPFWTWFIDNPRPATNVPAEIVAAR